MKHKEVREKLTEAFRALPKADRDRLMWHVEQGTRIICGTDTANYGDGKGGG